jgi:hypothetical protein
MFLKLRGVQPQLILRNFEMEENISLEAGLKEAPKLRKELIAKYGPNLHIKKIPRMNGEIKNALSAVEVIDMEIYAGRKKVGVYTEHWVFTGLGTGLRQEYNGKKINED